MRDALRRTVVLGVVTNLSRLQAILAHPAFVRGDLHTGFIDEHLAPAAETPGPPPEAIAAAAAALHLARSPSRTGTAIVPDPWATLGPWRLA